MIKIKISGHYLTCMLNKENFQNMQSYYGQQSKILELYVMQVQKLGFFLTLLHSEKPKLYTILPF